MVKAWDTRHGVRNRSLQRYHSHTVKFKKFETFFSQFYIFLPILYITKKIEVYVQCCMVKILQIRNFSTQ